MKRLSVVIPFYGNPEDTINLVHQLQEQICSKSFEIIVSDDASPIPFPQVEGVTVVRREFNGGFGANVNTGVEAATGEWILILNSDLTLPANFLANILSAGEEEKSRAEGRGVILAPHIVGHSGESQWVGRKFPTTMHHAWEWFTPVARFRNTKFWHYMVGHDLACTDGQRATPDWLMGACMLLPRDLYLEVGGMDESFFMNSEEVDLQYRLAFLGIPRIFRGDIIVSHIGGGSSGTSRQRLQWVTNSRFKYEEKWGNPRRLKISLIVVTFINYIFNIVRSTRNHAITPQIILKNELSAIRTASQQLGETL